MSLTIYFNYKQTTWFYLQSNVSLSLSLKCYFPSFSVTLLCTAWRIFLWCPSVLLLGSSSQWPPHLRKRSSWWSPWASEIKKVTQSKFRWIRRLFQYGSVPFCSGCCEQMHCHGVAAMICLAMTLFLFLHTEQSLHMHNTLLSPYTGWSISSDCDRVFPNQM